MLFATVLALGAAVIHAGWNLVAKRADGDRYVLLWAQFLAGGVICLPLLVIHEVVVGMPREAFLWALASGCVHLPYTWLLARAYSTGDFSVSYPVARGGGAALAALGGVIALGDRLGALETTGIAVVVLGLMLLAYRAAAPNVILALMVAVTIGAYTTLDAKGSRAADTAAYVLVSTVGTALTNTVFSLSTGRGPALVALLRTSWRRAAVTGLASTVTYGLVLVAVRHASVGYVAAMRESSVVLAALAGWRLLGEGDHRRRLTAAAVVFSGLIVLVVGG